jgi:WD repeat-containing protein 26
VYHTITFANLHVLKGHQGEVTHVTWSQDDLKLVSCADNGSVYEWNAATGNIGNKINEVNGNQGVIF